MRSWFATAAFLILVGTCAAETVIFPADFAEKVDAAVREKRFDDVKEAFFDLVQSGNDGKVRTAAALTLLEMHSSGQCDLLTAQKAIELVQPLRSQVSDSLKYELDMAMVDILKRQGEYAEAARQAGVVRTEWEKRVPGTLTVFGEEARLLVLADKKDELNDLISKTWRAHPNDFARNAAVRVEAADAMASKGDALGAFHLLDELRGAFPTQLRESPYIVQNYVEYASRTAYPAMSAEERERLLEVMEWGSQAAQQPGFERTRAGIYYAVAKFYHVCRHVEAATQYYELAIENASGDGVYDRNLATWSQQAIDRIAKHDFDDLIEQQYGPSFAGVAKWFADPANWEQVDTVFDTSDSSGEQAAPSEQGRGVPKVVPPAEQGIPVPVAESRADGHTHIPVWGWGAAVLCVVAAVVLAVKTLRRHGPAS